MGKFNESVFKSDKHDWGTPQWLFDKLNTEFNFTFDPCTNGKNSKCAKFSTDSLNEDWSGEVVFMNPPYSEVKVWMKKAYDEAQKGATVVCLVPSRTDTRWFHQYALEGDVRFLDKRLKFEGANNMAPFPACVVVFKPKLDNIE